MGIVGYSIESIAPIDEADACGMNLYNIVTRTWDDDILSAVAGCGPNPNSGDVHPESERKTGYEGGLTGERLRDMLGEVERDGGKIIGKVAGWFVQRFGFDPGSFPFRSLSFQWDDAVVERSGSGC